MLGSRNNKASVVWDRIWESHPYACPEIRSERSKKKVNLIYRHGFCPKPGDRILEVGCGSGQNMVEVISRTSQCVTFAGCDCSAAAIGLAHSNLKAYASMVELRVADVLSLPYASGSFNAVLAFGVIEHVRDMLRALCEIRRVTAQSGELYFVTSSKLSLMYPARLGRQLLRVWPYGYQMNLTPRAAVSVVSNGFDVVAADYLHGGTDHPICSVVDRVLALGLRNWGRYIFLKGRAK